MKSETIQFSSGNLIINDTFISFHGSGRNFGKGSTISRENIGHADTELITILPQNTWVHSMQVLGGGFLVALFGLIAGSITDDSMYIAVAWLGGIGILLGLFLYFGRIIDGAFGMNLTTSIFTKIFGVESYRVVVQNIYGGNNLEFIILKTEISKLPQLVKYKINKKENNDTSLNEKNSIDDLEKLANLKEKGIITDEEFTTKKKKILGI